jgi:hypothetical protein
MLRRTLGTSCHMVMTFVRFELCLGHGMRRQQIKEQPGKPTGAGRKGGSK